MSVCCLCAFVVCVCLSVYISITTYVPWCHHYRMQVWRKHFTDLAVITMDVVSKQLLLWIPNIIELDQVCKQSLK